MKRNASTEEYMKSRLQIRTAIRGMKSHNTFFVVAGRNNSKIKPHGKRNSLQIALNRNLKYLVNGKREFESFLTSPDIHVNPNETKDTVNRVFKKSETNRVDFDHFSTV